MLYHCKNKTLSFSTLICLTSLVLAGCNDSEKQAQPKNSESKTNSVLQENDLNEVKIATQIETFCADCHAMPLASAFPKKSWPEEVEKGFNFYLTSGRSDLTPPVPDSVTKFFADQAPEQLDLSGSIFGKIDSKNEFERIGIGSLPDAKKPPAVANVNVVKLTKSNVPYFVFTDMDSGDVGLIPTNDENAKTILAAKLNHPAHAETCDINRDGLNDLVIADLGSFLPEDNKKGKVQIFSRPGQGHQNGDGEDLYGRFSDRPGR